MHILIFKGGGFEGCFWQWNCAVKHNEEWREVYVSGWRGKEAVKLGFDNYVKETSNFVPGHGLVWDMLNCEDCYDMEALLAGWNASMIDAFIDKIRAITGNDDWLDNVKCECQSDDHEGEYRPINYENLYITKDGKDFICEACHDRGA